MDYCKDNKSQKSIQYGFNEYIDYVSELPEIEGGQLLAAQKLWKENKDNNRPIIAVFVADGWKYDGRALLTHSRVP